MSIALLTLLSHLSVASIAPFPRIAAIDIAVVSHSNAAQQLQQGVQLYQSERFAEAVNQFQQAAHTFQAQGDRASQAQALHYLALTYQQLGHGNAAQQAITTSLTLLGPDASLLTAQTLNTQGRLYLTAGQSEKALTSWEQASAIYTQLGDAAGSIGAQINQAQALQAMGMYRRSLLILTQVNRQLQQQPNSALKATGLLSLGNTLRVVGVLDQATASSLAARQVLEQSLAIADAVRSPELKADVLLSLGITAQAQRQFAQAMQYYQQAAATSAAATTQLQARLNQLRLLVETRQGTEAQTLWTAIQPQLETLPASRKAVYARLHAAQSLLCLNGVAGHSRCHSDDDRESPITPDRPSSKLAWTSIARTVAAAVKTAKMLGDQRAEAYALGALGSVYEQTQQWSAAQDLTQRSLRLAEDLGASDIAYQGYWQLGRILKAPSNSQGSEKRAIAAYSRAVELLKSLRSDLVAMNREVQFSFREGVEPVYREFVSLLLQSNPGQAELAQARTVIELLQLAELDNFFRRACLDAKPVQIDQIDQTAAVIYPVILPDRIEVILSLPTSSADATTLRYHTVRLPQSQVEATLASLQTKLVTRSTPEFLPMSRKLYDWLIRPIAAELKTRNIKTLVFVLDGSLRSIPMAALNDGKQYLVENYDVALTPGLQLLNPRPLVKETLNALAAGLTDAREPEFSALPNVQTELQQIQSEIPSRILLNQGFTRAAIQEQVKSLSASVVHLATHGQFGSTADETFVLTYDDRLNVEELSALLRTRETNQQGAIELLVLSACKTATGDRRAALGIAGVAVRSGARSTLATLWSVDDDATARVMGQFYKALRNTSLTKAAALKRAQLTLLSDPQYRHPFYWAPYILVGNWL
ncbi:CHAT domain-containing protein [Leptolyngbya sp. FACHB-36]|uniref:CHAT domain-containing protein n=1 Tax=Leptolyngbya sp. FACHB-36 TaxID=2692808 RepID=UPI0016816D52|nr:CHAT domain-containing protein [Leptolyngbya sp. FACHB-36]MBD2021757.1 CHAT domain-containing protein [Leptolyngbya sp. FACHB-36]